MDTTHLNADFTERVVVRPVQDGNRQASPEPGVHPHRLDRIGDEAACAISIVRCE